MLRLIWKRRHRIFSGTRRGQAWLGKRLANLPLPASAKIILSDMLFTGLEAFIFRTETYQKWARSRAGRSRIHALLRKSNFATPEPFSPTAPTQEQWNALTITNAHNDAAVDVIVPVYNGHDAALRCIYAVLSNKNETPFELIVINDASTDTALVAMLYELAVKEMFTLLENDTNLGFVATVNRGMKLHEAEGRDVVLLNSDTHVEGNWLDRLRSHAAGKRIGSVTPFSNNAGICSYPVMAADNSPLPEADRLAAEANTGQSCEVPTAVGFCMYIPRACLAEVGYFDEVTFGRGYGEENDFCLRASRQRYRHLLAGDVYVLHAGGVSFGEDKSPKEKAAWKLLKRLYPEYSAQVAHFLMDDPALPLRQALDLARLAARAHTRNVLMITHAFGGGTHKYIMDKSARITKEENTGCFLLQPYGEGGDAVMLSHPDIQPTPNLVFHLDADPAILERALRMLNISRMEVHHLLGFPEGMAECVQRLARRLGTGYEVMIHDYFYACPRINMTTEEGAYCGEPDIKGCETCIRTRFSYAGATPVWLWRERAQTFLRGARYVTVPDADVATRMQRYFPDIAYRTVPHEASFSGAPALGTNAQPGEEVRIGILGALSVIKGAKVVEALAKDAARRALPLKFILIGYSDYPPLERGLPHLRITGRYEEDGLEDLLRTEAPHLLFFPSIWPETYSYTLSYAFRFHIPPVAFSIGAQASRIEAQRFGSVLDLALADNPAALNDALLSIARNAEYTKEELHASA